MCVTLICDQFSIYRFNFDLDTVPINGITGDPVELFLALVSRRFDWSKILLWEKVIVWSASIDFLTAIVFSYFPALLAEVVLEINMDF